jgi:predicted transcriptional regulator
MKTKELLLECKVRLKVSSDYAVAKALEIDRATVSHYMKGTRKADEYACFKIAECLGRDPAQVIAEVNAENDTKQGVYFRDFLRRQSLPVLVALSVSTSCATYTPEASAAAPNGAHNVYYVK